MKPTLAIFLTIVRSGRFEIDYLLENILAPSAVVSAEYSMTSIAFKDGRVLAGVIEQERLLSEETMLELAEITKREPVPVSIMPEGLFDALGEEGAWIC
jgi:putative heme-binding domain-containing protein